MGKHVLIITTSHDKLGDTNDKTGLWAEELAGPYYHLKDAGFDVTISSIKGGRIPLDQGSLADNFKTPAVERMLKDDEVQKRLESSPAFTSAAGTFDAVFLPGGHGTVFDYPASTALADLLNQAWKDGKVVAAVCHGPAGLVNAKDTDGKPLVAGRRVTGFSNTEEEAVGKTKVVPFLLEDKLVELGAKYEKKGDWEVFALTDGRLITGQNPQSSVKVAELIAAALQ